LWILPSSLTAQNLCEKCTVDDHADTFRLLAKDAATTNLRQTAAEFRVAGRQKIQFNLRRLDAHQGAVCDVKEPPN
jgi:hypothetical protein